MDEDRFAQLNRAGLNMQAVFDLADLPESIRLNLAEQIEELSQYRQLLMIGHGGKVMWQALSDSGDEQQTDPIDTFSTAQLKRWFSEKLPDANYRIIYPVSQHPLALQSLGRLAGWHHDSPFRIGINRRWGSWFAYRAVALADSDLEPTVRMAGDSPCLSCVEKVCIDACPPAALTTDVEALNRCIDYRRTEHSACSDRCLARLACPVASDERYSMAQMNYHYGCSMATLKKDGL